MSAVTVLVAASNPVVASVSSIGSALSLDDTSTTLEGVYENEEGTDASAVADAATVTILR